MKKQLVFIALIMLITGCSNTAEPVIQKVENIDNTEVNTGPEFIEEDAENDEEVIEYIDFLVDDELVRVSLQAIPILDNYLMGVSDKRAAVESMNLERLPIDEQTIYLLEFSCQSDLCSYLLIKPNEENQSYLLTDMATYEETILSPDRLVIVMQFSRPSSYNFPLHHIIAINSETWEVLSLKSEMDSEDILHYTWPFITVEWMSDSRISITKHNPIKMSDEDNIHPPVMQNDTTTTILSIE